MHRMVKDISILDHSYIPENLPGREDELKELRSNLRFCEQISKHINLQGKSGTGKTATVNKICHDIIPDLKEKGAKIEYFYINCKTDDTRFKVLKTICEKMCEGERLPNTSDDLYRKMLKQMNGNNKYDALIIFLDEIDALARKGEDELTILYELSRLKAHQKTSCNISTIIATNRFDFFSTLDSRAQSSFRAKPLLYHAYDSEILQEILRDRANAALYDNVLDDDVIPLCSALAAQEHGDARKAIDLLRTAIEVALDENSTKVKKEHVKKARVRVEEDKTYDEITKLPFQQKLVLFASYNVIKSNIKRKIEPKTRTSEVYDEYTKLCKHAMTEPCSSRWVRENLADLDTLGFIRMNLISFGRYGRTHEIKIPMPLEILGKVLINDWSLNELFEQEDNNNFTSSLDAFGASAV